MASTPDPHADSIPEGPSDDPERVSPATSPDRETVEDTPGDPGGTAAARDRGPEA